MNENGTEYKCWKTGECECTDMVTFMQRKAPEMPSWIEVVDHYELNVNNPVCFGQ